MNLLTASRLRALQTCARKHYYRYELGLAAPETGAMAFGTAIHAGLEAWWIAIREGAPELALEAALAQLTDSLAPFDRARAEAMLAAYDVQWRRWACGVDVLAIEAEFRAPLHHPDTGKPARTWELAGKMDALVSFSDGRVAIIEHKTTSRDASAGSDYRARLTMDAQVSMYFDGAAALGHAADLCIYDVLVKPAQKPKEATATLRLKKNGEPCAGQRVEAETLEEYRTRLAAAIASDPDKYLVHADIRRFDADRTAHTRDAWEAVHLIEHARARALAGALPPRNAHACFEGGHCPYLALCQGRARIEDYPRAEVHAELTAMTTEAA